MAVKRTTRAPHLGREYSSTRGAGWYLAALAPSPAVRSSRRSVLVRRSVLALTAAALLVAVSSMLLALAVETEWLGLRDPLYAEKAELLKRTWAADETA